MDQAEGQTVAGGFSSLRQEQGADGRAAVRSERAEQDVVFAAVREFFAFLETKKYKLHVRVFLSRYRGYARCPECHGTRLRKEALWVRVGGKNIADVLKLNIGRAYAFIERCS